MPGERSDGVCLSLAAMKADYQVFIRSGVLRGTLDIPNEWAFRIPFALQWLWPPLIAIGVILSPESPWWLVRHGRLEDARRSLRTFTGKTNTEEDIENTIQHM